MKINEVKVVSGDGLDYMIGKSVWAMMYSYLGLLT